LDLVDFYSPPKIAKMRLEERGQCINNVKKKQKETTCTCTYVGLVQSETQVIRLGSVNRGELTVMRVLVAADKS